MGKSTVGEVGSGSRFADSWRSRRSKPTSDDERLDVTAEVDRCGGVVDLVRQDKYTECAKTWHPSNQLQTVNQWHRKAVAWRSACRSCTVYCMHIDRYLCTLRYCSCRNSLIHDYMPRTSLIMRMMSIIIVLLHIIIGNFQALWNGHVVQIWSTLRVIQYNWDLIGILVSLMPLLFCTTQHFIRSATVLFMLLLQASTSRLTRFIVINYLVQYIIILRCFFWYRCLSLVLAFVAIISKRHRSLIYNVSGKRCQYTIVSYFARCWPMSKILSPADLVVNY